MVMEPPMAMEHPTLVGHSQRRQDEPEFDMNEWYRIRRENTRRGNSRRYSASFVGTFREDEEVVNKSFTPNFPISSTTSSPGYTMRALKAKNIYSWEPMSPEGRLALNSKWSEAERFICNPVSGEVPLECLSADSLRRLSGRSVHQFSSTVSISAPDLHPLPPCHLKLKPSITLHEDELKFHTREEKIDSMKRDAGTEIPPLDNMESSNPSPVTPSIKERAINHSGADSEDSLEYSEDIKFDVEVEMKEANDEDEQGGREKTEGENYQNGSKKTTSSNRRGGCFVSWRTLWKKRNHENNNINKKRKKNTLSFFATKLVA
ncbi:hypothetical protein Leryth_018526 [Lithospermum erythrorhizon]|nr:hypothetical protein Leryth_018526 [Lithospermum erythrorhizon]